MTETDIILDASQAFVVGSFNNALKHLKKLKTNDSSTKLKADVITYGIYISEGKFTIVLDEISPDTDNVQCKLLRLLAEFFASPNKRVEILPLAEKIVSGSLDVQDETVLIVAARLFMNAGMYDSALKVLNMGNDVFCSAMTVQCLMAINRYDLAGKIVRRLQAADEDSLCVQLIIALYNLVKGGDQIQESLTIYEELSERYGPTPLLLNGRAAALIAMNRWEEAEAALQEAMDLSNANPDVLVNLIMVSHHLNKSPETIKRLMSQLKDCGRDHPLLLDLALKDEEFRRCSEQYAPMVAE